MLKQKSTNIAGTELSFESGRWARQAGGSVFLKWGKIVLMANATSAAKPKEGMDFFPLTVEYREKFYATGKIPGGFIKKEGRPGDREILTSRLTDRPLRPMFPSNFKNEVQVFLTLISSDKSNLGDVLAITAASCALLVSNIPFEKAVAGVRVCRVNGEYIVFPTMEQTEESDLNLILAGTDSAVTMIEGHGDEVSEEDMLVAIKRGHEEIKKLCALQEEFVKEAKSTKDPIQVEEAEDTSEAEAKVKSIGYDIMKEASNVKDKLERYTKIDEAKVKILELYNEKEAASIVDESEKQSVLSTAKKLIGDLEVDLVRDQIFNDKVRADGRQLDEIRDISIQVGMLPGVHGSSIFTRGETQSLGVATLATENSSQSIDDIFGSRSKNFYLHYNFPPYSVGEVRRWMPGGRREIGHGYLAENSLRAVLPDSDKFPYVVRVVSEILESNGSSSMASVCTGCLSMMDAGVPIKAPVAGIAMGLITKGDDFAILSDIAGLEDHFGDMDFKVAGTTNGITGFQLDMKVEGISYDIMVKAMEQAKAGRLHILAEMGKALEAPRAEISGNAPQIFTMQIDKEKIGELIGPGGKNIRSIIEKTGVEINVDDSGTVRIAATDGDSANFAKEMIQNQFAEAEINKIYQGTVKTITDFGAFIEILPGKEGLCHISKISSQRVAKVTDVVSEGETVDVKVLSVDHRSGKIALSIKDV